MSQQQEEKEPLVPAGPAIKIQMGGKEFLAPEIPPSMRGENFYVGGTNLPLGNFEKGHELAVIGFTWLRTWSNRITTSDPAEKKKQIETLTMVVGQSSRARGGATQTALTKETMEIIQRQQQKKGFLSWLLGR